MLANRPNRPNRPSSAVAAAALLLAPCAPTLGGVLWSEQLDGDFSGDRLAPTPLTLPEGTSALFGRIDAQDDLGNLDLDYFSVAVPAGFHLTGILLEDYLSTDFVAFIAIDDRPVFSIAPEDATTDNLFGWLHFGVAEIGQDILPRLGASGRGFTPPLPLGVYTFWVQQIGDLTEYTVVFTLEPVPAPGAAAILPLAALLRPKRRHAQRARSI